MAIGLSIGHVCCVEPAKYVENDTHLSVQVAQHDGEFQIHVERQCRRRSDLFYEPCGIVEGASVHLVGGMGASKFNILLGKTNADGDLRTDISGRLPDHLDSPQGYIRVRGISDTPVDLSELRRDDANAGLERRMKQQQATAAQRQSAVRQIIDECIVPDTPTKEHCRELVRIWQARCKDEATRIANESDPRECAQIQQAMVTLEGRLSQIHAEAQLDVTPCSLATGPTSDDISRACKPLQDFLAHYPNSTRAVEVRTILAAADGRAAPLLASERAAQERRDRIAREAQERRDRAANAERKAKCLAACRIGCADKLHVDICLSACPTLCQ